jgi:hypothetical protein
LLARAQIGDRCLSFRCLDPKRDATARAAAVEAEDETGSFGRAAMHM